MVKCGSPFRRHLSLEGVHVEPNARSDCNELSKQGIAKPNLGIHVVRVMAEPDENALDLAAGGKSCNAWRW